MLKKIALVLAGLIVGLLAYAATRPDAMRVERTATIKAPPDRIFPLINDFHRWSEWSPWEKLDPAMTRTHSGAGEGRGAVYEWAGNSDVGSGRMEITDSAPPSRVAIQLDFLEPFEAHNTTVFTLNPRADGTEINWAMDGPSPYIAKLMGVFVDMDAMIGRDFESGLQNLKTAAER